MSERAQALEHLQRLAGDIGDVRDVAGRRSDPNRDHRQMLLRLGQWRGGILTVIDILQAPAEGVSPPPAPVSPVEPHICICPACLGSGGPCDLCEGTGDVQDLPARRLFPVEPTPEPPRLDADYTDPRFWASGVPNQPQFTGEPAPCVWRAERDGDYATGCGRFLAVMADGGFCRYCGHPLTVER